MADPQTYHITDPSTGKTLTLQGESPPTEQELNDIFSQVHGTTTSMPAESPSWMSLAGTTAKTVAKDVVLGGPAMVWDAAKNAYAREQAGNQAMSSGDVLGAMKHYALENPIAHLVGEPMAHEAQQAVESAQQGRYSEAVGHGVASALPVIGPTAAGIGSQIGSGDPRQQAEAVGHLAAMALGPKALEYGMKGIGAGVSAVRGMVPEQASTTLMMRAANPSAARVGFPERLPSAMNDLKAVEVARGTPAADLDGVLADIKTAKQANREQYSQLKDPQAQRGAVVDGTPIAKAMEDSIPLRTRQQNPAKTQQIMARAETYRRDIPVMEVDQLLQETNADLDSYFGKNPAARQSAKTSNPDIADKVAEASALRDQLYAKLDEPTGGDAARELQRRYGALSDLDRALQAQRIKALRMKPDAMVEGLGKLAAAGKFAKAGVRAVSGDPMGALMDVAQGVAERKMGQYIAESRTTDALIRRAMAVHQQLPSPIQMPQPPVIRGLLPAPATPLGAAPEVPEPPMMRQGVWNPDQRLKALPQPARQAAAGSNGPIYSGEGTVPLVNAEIVEPEPPIAQRGEWGTKWVPTPKQIAAAPPSIRGLLQRAVIRLGPRTRIGRPVTPSSGDTIPLGPGEVTPEMPSEWDFMLEQPKPGQLSAIELRELERIHAELEAMPFQKKFSTDTGAYGQKEWHAGAGGAPVFSDIIDAPDPVGFKKESGIGTPSRSKMAADINMALRGGHISRLAAKAIIVARARAVGGYPPMDAGNLPGTLSRPKLPPWWEN